MKGAMRVEDLRYRYADGREALRGVSFKVEAGQCVGLIGPNGAGKSTLLLHLNGLLPDGKGGNGSVHLDGKAIGETNPIEVRKRVGLLFQDPDDQLFCPTVYEDVAFGPEQFGLKSESVAHAVQRALAQVGLDGFEDRAPHHLSGGEKRLVCLAGVLACEPEVLVLDEPTSGLDPRGRRQIKELLRGIRATRIIATHDLELVVELCDWAVLMDEGQVAAEDRTEKLLADEELMLKHGLEKPHILMHRHPHHS